MDGQTFGLQVVVAGEFQVVVQGFAVNGQLGGPGLGDGSHALLGGGVDEVDTRFGALRQPHHLPEGNVLGNVVVGQVQVGPVIAAFSLQLVLHEGYDVVLFSVHRHYAAVFANLLENLPQVSHGDPGVEGGENLEAGDPGLYRFANLAHGTGRYGPGQDVVKGVIDVGMAPESIAPGLNLAHYWIGGRHGAGRERQAAGEVHVGGNATESGGAAGGLRRLSKDPGVAAGPVIGDGHVDVRVGFYAAREDNHPSGVNGLYRLQVVQRSRRGHHGDLLSLDAQVHQSGRPGRYHGSAPDYQIEHDRLLK